MMRTQQESGLSEGSVVQGQLAGAGGGEAGAVNYQGSLAAVSRWGYW